MNQTVKRNVRSHRGIVGLETALVLIAFLIIAGAMAFVVLNMGFFTAQESKTTVSSALSGTSGTVMVSGSVVGSGHVAAGRINVTAIPIKISPSGDSLNIAAATTAIKYFNGDITYDNIYQGTLNLGVEPSLKSATAVAETLGYFINDPFVDNAHPAETVAFIYWGKNQNDNDILDFGEQAILAVVFAENDRPEFGDKIRIEMISKSGPVLTVELKIPQIHNEVIVLG